MDFTPLINKIANERVIWMKVIATVTIDDVPYPFTLEPSPNANILDHVTLFDFAKSEQIKSLIKKGTLSFTDRLHNRLPQIFERYNVPLDPQPVTVSPTPQREWELTQIPKTLHAYWGGDTFSFLRFMTLYSFRKYNPDWKINLHVPNQVNTRIYWPSDMVDIASGRNYFDSLKALDINIQHTDLSQFGLNNNMPEVHKSDFLRYVIMSNEGGVWSDMDILYFRPITTFSKNNKCSTDTFIYINNNNHFIGFLLSASNSKFYRNVLSRAKSIYKRTSNPTYQCIGADLLNKEFCNWTKLHGEYRIDNIDRESVYVLDNRFTYYLYTADGTGFIKDTSFGIHWHGGSRSSKTMLQNVNHENYLSYNSDSTVVKMLKQFFPEGIKL